jgi:hypothetical protein
MAKAKYSRSAYIRELHLGYLVTLHGGEEIGIAEQVWPAISLAGAMNLVRKHMEAGDNNTDGNQETV